MKILIVEDEPLILKAIELLLKKHNYEVITASLGSIAVKKIAEEKPDLILLDMYLPDMTGLKIMEKIQTIQPLTVIVMTAHSSEEIAIESLRLGAKDYILKPIKGDELLKRLERAFREIYLKKEEERLVKEKEMLLEQLKKVQEMKDKFLDMIIHNLKNPLNSVLGFASVLATREVSEKEKREYYKIIEEQGKRMLIMLDDLLRDSFYKEGKIPLKYTDLDINKLLEGVISNAGLKAEQKDIKFILDLEDNLTIKADGEKIIEILENILDNSLKFTPEKGEIKLKIKSNDGGISITVSDTGLGIPENLIDKIFLGTPLVSRKGILGERGTGLGLAFCKKVIDAHSGKINVTSTEFSGTEITINLPKEPILPVLQNSLLEEQIIKNQKDNI